MTGAQRYQQIRTKARLIAERQLREYLAGERDWLPCSGDLLDRLICAELDKLGGRA